VPTSSDHLIVGLVEIDYSYLNFVKVDFSNSGAALWKKGVQCSSGTGWSIMGGSEAVSDTGSEVYLLDNFDNHILFYTFDEKTGEVISMHKHDNMAATPTIGDVYEVNKRVYMLFDFTDTQILIYNTTTRRFDYSYWKDGSSRPIQNYCITKGDFMISFSVDPAALDLTLSKSHYTTFYEWNLWSISSFVLNPFSSGNHEIVDRSGADDVNYTEYLSNSLIPLSTIGFYSITNSSPVESYRVSIWNMDHYESNLLPNTRYELDFTWTCAHPAAFTILTYSLDGINAESVPGWASIDLPNKKVVLDSTPDIKDVSYYKFGFKAEWCSKTAVKNIYFTVTPWSVDNCKTWSFSFREWSKCKAGYELKEDKTQWVNAGEAESMATKILIATGVAISLGASALSMSSPQGAFSTLNQFQLFILLPMLGAYIPPKILQIILGTSFAMFSFSFIPLEKIPLINDLFNFIDYDQSDDYFDEIGLTSGSAILNHIALLLIFCVFILYHLSLLPCYQTSKQLSEKHCFRIIVKFLFNIMTFSLYVILIIESYLIVWLSTISELKEFDYSTGFKLFSLVLAFTFALGLLTVVIIAVIQIIKARPVYNPKKQWYFRELFNALKNNSPSRLFKLIFMIIRICFVLIIVLFSSWPVIVKVILFSSVQLISTMYTSAFRPFENIKDSVAEICNQFIFLIASSLLIHFDTKGEWNSKITTFYVYLIMTGPMIGSIISFIDIIFKIIKKIKNCRKRSGLSSTIQIKSKPNASSISMMHEMRSNYLFTHRDAFPQ
jgi:hypothetical protein